MEDKITNLQQSTFAITDWTRQLLQNWGISEGSINLFNLLLQLTIVILFIWVFQWIAQTLITFILSKLSRLKKLRFSKFLIESKFPHFLAITAPLIWVQKSIPVVFEFYPQIEKLILKSMNLVVIWLIYTVINSIFKAGANYLSSTHKFKDKPVQSYFQVARILVLILIIGATFTVLTGKDLSSYFTAMGAASAVMMLIFKDSILGFVASIQVTTNDMVRIGDWITMPKYGVDGDVKEISLTTVKVVNFDKTVSTIPTYTLISDSIQNWRGMSETGGRRIKRSIIIKQSSFKFIEKEQLEKYKKIQSLEKYIDERQSIIDNHNESINANMDYIINGRNQTNIGLYRKYIEEYLKSHPGIHKGLSIMVRQLAPTEKGLPLELYCFTNTTVWAAYEGIMADIFDHLISTVPYFDLEIFEDISNG